MATRIYTERSPFGGPRVRPRAIVAGGAPVAPPKEWFGDPGLDGPTPLTITADGRVFGHIAAWGVRHIGMPGHVVPPKSRSGYAFFKTGVVQTAEGEDVPVGQLTLAGGHAPLSADASQAVRHYDDTASAVADVTAGEDRHGIYVAGALRPSATPEQVRALRASAPSGDWRPINGGLELVAVCQVNVPGFPVARARVASGATMALVAAGAQEMAILRVEAALPLRDRVSALEAEVALMAAALPPEFLANAKKKKDEAKGDGESEPDDDEDGDGEASGKPWEKKKKAPVTAAADQKAALRKRVKRC